MLRNPMIFATDASKSDKPLSAWKALWLVPVFLLMMGPARPSVAQVTPGTIDFNTVTMQGESQITERGVFFGDTTGEFDGWVGEPNFGNLAPEVDAYSLSSSQSTTQARFVSDDGSEFQLDGLDFDNYTGDCCVPTQFTVVIVGYRDGSAVTGQVTEQLENTSGDSWETITFGSDFENIDEVRISTNGYNPPGTGASNIGLAMDNVIVDNAVTNTAPTFTAGSSTPLTVDEDAAATSISAQLEADDPDGGQTLTWTVSAAPSNGSLSGFSTTASAGSNVQPSGVTYEPNTDYSGSDAFDVQVDDGNGGSDVVTVNVDINNLAPVFNSSSTASFAENGTGTVLDVNADDGGDGANDSGVDYSITGGTDSGEFNINTSTGELSFTSAPDFENPTDSDGQNDYVIDVTADDGASSNNTTTQTITVTVTDVNEPPTISSISDQTIEEDGTLSSLSFTVDDPETSDLSNLTLSGSSGNTTLVPNSNISFTGPDASGNASITAQPASNESGTATITVTVDDGAASNNTASEQFTLTVNAVPDLTITDGGSNNLDFSGSVTVGTNDNPIGIFELSAGQSGVSFDEVTITNKSSGVSGISAARLYWSSDQTLEPGSDMELDEVTTNPSSAPSTITFSGFNQSIPTSARYAILAIDVQSGASADVQFELAQDGDLSTSGGEIATVNGTPQSTFSALPLSNGTTALPVELARFDATTSEGGAVTLRWQTVSETDNAGFEIQRVKASRTTGMTSDPRDASNWQTVGSVDGAGTTTKAQSYRFADTNIPYGADSLTYRLKQVDTDGTAAYSEPITVARRTVEQVQLLGTFPNPAYQQTTIRFAIPDGSAQDVTLRLHDALGRQVRTVQTTAEAGRHTVQINTGQLSSGIYFLRLLAGSTVKTQKLTVVR